MLSENPSFTLRLATPADNILLAEIGAETFAATFGADNTPDDMAQYLAQSFSPDIQAGELADPANRFLVLETQGQVGGYAKLRFAPAPGAVAGHRPMEIARIYARPGWIGQGVGARLMRACLDQAAQAGCDVVWLGVWERNSRAIAFYRKWGFETAGTQQFRLWADVQNDLIMARAAVPESTILSHAPDQPPTRPEAP